MLLEYPHIAALPCSDCQRWVYDIDRKDFAHRGGKRVERQPAQKTPCGRCPKKSPENAKRLELTERNKSLIRRYKQVRATGGACLTEAERSDGWLIKMLAIVDQEFRAFESDQQTRNLLDIVKLVKGL